LSNDRQRLARLGLGQVRCLGLRRAPRPDHYLRLLEERPHLVHHRGLDCVFRRKPAGDSDPFQPVIPTEASH
jgi:hypothetical protein